MPRLSPDIVEAFEAAEDQPDMSETPELDFPDSFSDTSEQTLALEDDGLTPEATDVPPATVQEMQDREPLLFEVTTSDRETVDQNSVFVELPVSTMVNPRSSAVNFQPPLPITKEQHAVDALLPLAESLTLDLSGAKDKASTSDFVYINLDDFEIYNDILETKTRLRSLHLLATNGTGRMYFDGVLSVDTTRFYVQRVPFSKAPVDRYGIEFDTAKGYISIRSTFNEGRHVYYRLGRPSTVYARFYQPYLWVADLGKHFIDFVNSAVDRGRDVRVSHFRLHFAKWLQKTHSKSAAVAAWRNEYGVGRDDFAPAVVAHGEYLRKEAGRLLEDRVVGRLGFFREIQSTFYKTHEPSIPEGHPVDANGQPRTPLPTVVTPYMHHMFKDLAIGKYLQRTPGKHALEKIDGNLILPQQRSPFITGIPTSDLSQHSAQFAQRIKNVQPGDLISTLPDDATTNSKWLASAEKSAYWYALVHRAIEPQPKSRNERSFHVVWLYRPEHTPCGAMKYPWANELFMCDHCTCDEVDDQAGSIMESEVTGIHSVEWFGGPDTTADFFIRQTYLHGERSWVKLQLGHIFCKDSANGATRAGSALASHFGTIHDPVESIGVFQKIPDYAVGDTVLASRSRKSRRSEPYEVVSLPGPDSNFCLRRLLRRNEVDPHAHDAPPNELVYTDEIVTLSKNGRVLGRCVVRVFPETKSIPTPYNRNGAGNIFYMTRRMDKKPKTIGSDIPGHHSSKASDYDVRFVPLDASKDAPNLRQGFDPSTPVPRLRAMELFCGCGNLGRGIEDAGATETRCANDIWPGAMHTFMANVASPDGVQPFIGSADTLLERAICRSPSVLQAAGIPVPGDIDFISGGSPCQGFSARTRNKEAKQQYKNRSMVASFASFIDLYRPKFGILENVPAIVNNGGHKTNSKKKDIARIREDIFGQLICSFLGLGYQLRIMLGNAWMYGAPQRRQRVFLIFVAPSCELLDVPLPSHGSPPDLGGGSQRTVGRLATGEWITRTGHENVLTAFPFVSAGEATADLTGANITDGIVDICVKHPDHRIISHVTTRMKAQMAAIPTQPFAMGLTQTRQLPYFRHVLASAEDFRGKPLFSQRELSLPITRAFMRTNPTRLFRTICTSCTVADARSAGELHWHEPRPLSILEVRRAQGLPDDDVLLGGGKVGQWKMVGNAVARQIALALGLSLREAWLGTLCEDRRPTTALDETPLTTTATATLVTTPTLSTATTTSTTADVSYDNMPFKKNRIFQTSVYKSASTSFPVPDPPIVVDESANDSINGTNNYKTLKRSRWSSQVLTDDVTLAKRQQKAGSNAGDRSV
ncbi:hypothetical protein SEUCBS140593_008061 [Sporothrix eucalyptigena]|uniref:DNA (cytosine-5-)-methyltransferase n=1 Tax=Sporothrix eucalyptigena TaxID=1812306 RepID=A0ABP0CJ07_9PEZI